MLDNYSYNHAEIDGIEIYTDNPSFMEYKQFHMADEEIKNTKWFQRVMFSVQCILVSYGKQG